MTRTEIAALFDRHKSVPELSRALMVLHNRGLVRFDLQRTKGRPVERWFAVWKTEPAT
jgi:predicted transcriptional regulator